VSLPASEKETEGLTWGRSGRYSHVDRSDEPGNDQGGKYSSKPLVSLCHGVYPMAKVTRHANALIRNE
jgi:hypothetical protein